MLESLRQFRRFGLPSPYGPWTKRNLNTGIVNQIAGPKFGAEAHPISTLLVTVRAIHLTRGGEWLPPVV
jgi:hypothetical protein